MKIAFVEPHLLLYGGIRRIIELSNRMTRLGEDVTIYHPTGEPCQWMHGEAKTKPIGAIFETAHDAVIFNHPPQYKIIRDARANLKVFYILCLHERERLKRFDPRIFWYRRGGTMALKRALQMPFLKVSNATWMQRFLREELQMESELQIGGVNRDMFYPARVQKNPDEFRVLYSGDSRERKGKETVVRAFETVKQRYPQVVLDTYHGKNVPQEKMAEMYSAADLFVDAQWYAGWNNPVAEAMACGVPVVCTDIGGVEDFAIHEETALLVPVADADAMAASIGRLLDDPALRERLKSNAYNKIVEFDWDDAARRFVDMLRQNVASTIS